MVKGKKGWIRIVEAFVAIVLVAGVMLVIFGESYVGKENYSEEIYEIQANVLRDIQVEDSLRELILDVSEEDIKTGDAGFPAEVQEKLNSGIPNYLECVAHICNLETACTETEVPAQSVYVKSVAIAATETQYNPKQLKLFCWMK